MAIKGNIFKMKTKDDEILNKIKSLVNQQSPTAKIYLYGSRSRGNPKTDSDWDLLILLQDEKVSVDTEQKITYPLYDLEFETGEIISPMVYSEKDWFGKYSTTPYYKNIMKDGKLL